MITDKSVSNDIRHDLDTINQISAITDILEVICRTTGLGFATVARVTDEKWVALATRDELSFGLKPGDELKLETTLCYEVSRHHEAIVIDNVKEDDNYCGHHTPLMYQFQSYISVPIVLKNGSFFGTLCALDPKPANLKNSRVLEMFSLFADLISFHLNAAEELRAARWDLTEEKRVAELREQFIAVLGHDLRTPITAIANSVQVLETAPDEKVTKRILTIIRNSSFRIQGLIDNILDFAKGRLGSGLTINRENNVPVETLVNRLIAEIKAAYPHADIRTDFSLVAPVHCDESALGQLLSNLLVNAIIHGDKSKPVQVQAVSNSKGFSMSVCNTGTVIPKETLAHIFQPFYRGGDTNQSKGLGLGLYIASEIARAHDGQLVGSSGEEGTCFTFQMPGTVA